MVGRTSCGRGSGTLDRFDAPVAANRLVERRFRHRERADAAGTIAAEYLDVVVFREMECAGF
jgi:hypothetical protein